jgi:hypothetical protein
MKAVFCGEYDKITGLVSYLGLFTYNAALKYSRESNHWEYLNERGISEKLNGLNGSIYSF